MKSIANFKVNRSDDGQSVQQEQGFIFVDLQKKLIEKWVEKAQAEANLKNVWE